MAAITNYTTLAAAIESWDERDHDVDEIIGLAEAEFRLYLGPNFAKEATATVAFTSGSAALPTGYVRTLALTHSTYGEVTGSTIRAVRQMRIAVNTGIPSIYAVFGSTIEVGPSYTGNLTLDYEGTLAGLSDSNATNWLITNAPQAYLAMCMSVAKAKFEDFQTAALYKAQAMRTLEDLGIQSTVAQMSGARPVLSGVTP
jgi:acyl-coenzyme A synthetase/AMP-(fatty) acid ligase